MIKERINISLDDTWAYMYRQSNTKNADAFKIRVENYINMFQKIAEADLNQLSDEEYYQLLTQIYSITLDKKDYLEIFSELYNKEYTNFYLIATKMTLEDTETTGYHHSFDWWKQLYQVYYIIAATSKMAENKNFSKNEMKKMLQNNEIVILCEKTKPVEESDLDFKQESYEKLPSLNFELLEKKDSNNKEIPNFLSLCGRIARKKITPEIIRNDIKIMLNELDKEIKEVWDFLNAKDFDLHETAKMCKNWYETSNAKKEYQRLVRKLKK